jgi:hypothetical protein
MARFWPSLFACLRVLLSLVVVVVVVVVLSLIS